MGIELLRKQKFHPKLWVDKFPDKFDILRAEAPLVLATFIETIFCFIEKEFSIRKSDIRGRSTNKDLVAARRAIIYLAFQKFPGIHNEVAAAFLDKDRYWVYDTLDFFFKKTKNKDARDHFEKYLKKISEFLKNATIDKIVAKKEIKTNVFEFYEAGVKAGFSDEEILRFSVKLFGA